MSSVLRIEDDDEQLKVPRNEIPPVRPKETAATLDTSGHADAARLLGQPTTTTTITSTTAPRQIPGLAFRHLQQTKKENER